MATKYWEHRAELRQSAYDRADNKLVGKISNTYDRVTRQLDGDIQKILGTYSRKTGLSPDEARQILTSGVDPGIIPMLRGKLAVVKDPKERLRIQTLLRTNRYQDRITRMQAIQIDARIAMTRAAEVQLSEMPLHLRGVADIGYKRMLYDAQKTTGFGFEGHGIPDRQMDGIIKSNWSGINYADRVWMNRDALADRVDSMMMEQISMGKLSDPSIKDLRGMVDLDKWRKQATTKFRDEMQYAKYAANRLVRTETSYAANEAVAIAYDEVGVEKYEYIATLDRRTSSKCQDHDGLIDPDTHEAYTMDKKEVGKNWPPLHPHCRSGTAPVLASVDRSKLRRRARNADGSTTMIPADMDYTEWKRWQDAGAPGDIKAWRSGVPAAPAIPKVDVAMEKARELREKAEAIRAEAFKAEEDKKAAEAARKAEVRAKAAAIRAAEEARNTPTPSIDPNVPTLTKFEDHRKEYIKDNDWHISKVDQETQVKFLEMQKAVLEQHDFVIKAKGTNAIKILEEGRFKNQFETGTSGGYLGTSDARNSRIDASQNLFGWEGNELKSHEYEKYGYLANKDHNAEIKSNAAAQYGDITFVMNKERLAGRVTYTMDDSLSSARGQRVVAAPVDTPDLLAVPYSTIEHAEYYASRRVQTYYNDFKRTGEAPDPTRFADSCYTELQYHGDIRLEHVQSVYFPYEAFQKDPTRLKLKEMLDAKGIPWEEIKPKFNP